MHRSQIFQDTADWFNTSTFDWSCNNTLNITVKILILKRLWNGKQIRVFCQLKDHDGNYSRWCLPTLAGTSRSRRRWTRSSATSPRTPSPPGQWSQSPSSPPCCSRSPPHCPRSRWTARPSFWRSSSAGWSLLASLSSSAPACPAKRDYGELLILLLIRVHLLNGGKDHVTAAPGW